MPAAPKRSIAPASSISAKAFFPVVPLMKLRLRRDVVFAARHDLSEGFHGRVE